MKLKIENWQLAILLAFFLSPVPYPLSPALHAQQPSTQSQPAVRLNVKYVQGVGIGYAPTAGAGLTLNLAAGTAFCSGVIADYAGGTLTMTNNTTNYVYLDSGASCVPAKNTTGFTVATVPLATVVTLSGAITTITDQRTLFNFVPGAGGVTSLDTLTGAVTTAIGTTGTAPNYTHAGFVDTLHIPMAATASVTAGLISKSEFDIFNAKAGLGANIFTQAQSMPFVKFTPQDTDPVGVANGWLWLTSHAHANPDEAYVYLNGVQRRVVVSGGAALLGTDTIFPVSTATTLGLGRLAATGTGISTSVASGVWTINTTATLPGVANTWTAQQTFQGATPIVLDGATAGTNATTVTVTDPTGARTFTVPDANSVAVQPATCAAGQHATAISAAGVVTCTDPILNKQDAAAEITGDGTDLTIYTYTVPANTIPSGGCIRAQVFAQHTTGADATTYKWYFGGTSIANSTSTSTGVWGSSLVLCNNTGVTNAQTMTQHAAGVGSTSQAAIIGTPAEDTTAAIILKATFSVANTSKITPKMFLVWHQ